MTHQAFFIIFPVLYKEGESPTLKETKPHLAHFWFTYKKTFLFRNSCSQMFFKLNILKNFATAMGNSIKLQTWRPVTCWKLDFNAGVFLWILQNLKSRIFHRTFGRCFCLLVFTISFSEKSMSFYFSHALAFYIWPIQWSVKFGMVQTKNSFWKLPYGKPYFGPYRYSAF